MDPDRWRRLEDTFHAALEVPAGERSAFIEQASSDDEELGQRLRAMVEADARSDWLDADVATVAREVLTEPDGAASTGTTIGPYRVKGVLGEGGSGIVYLGAREDIGHDVAIKVLRDAWVSSHRRTRFVAEQRTLAKLNHPAIAHILDAGVLAGGTPWFALELIDGVRLDEYCRQHIQTMLPLVRLFRAICTAVQHAHERLVVHRDLKPSNILVTADGQPKVIDFGIARQIEQMAIEGGHTGPLRMLTREYASPEELRGEVPGVAADVFSLGKILGERLADLADRPARRPIRGTRWAGRSTAHDLRLICDTASHADPQRRYQTVDALIRDLDALAAGRPIAARPATFDYRARRFVMRNRNHIAGLALALVVVGGVAATSAGRIAAARTAAAAEAERSERLLRFMLGLFEGGERGGAPPAELRVVSLLERGVQEARTLENDPRAQTEMLHTLGRVYHELGDLENADRLLTEALDRRLARLADQPADIVASLVALSELRLAQARLDEAQRLADDAGERAARALAPTALPRISALTAVGRVQRERGEYQAATTTLEGAVAAYQTLPAPGLPFADALSALSETLFYLGDLENAEAHSRRALELRRQLRAANHPDVGHELLTLGAIATARGQHPEAERLHREALQIFVSWFGEDHPESASAMTILGQALASQKRYEEGMGLLGIAIRVQERTFGERHPRTAFVQNAMGLMAFQSNDLPRAAAAFERAADGYGSSAGTHFQQGVSFANLGSVYLAQADHTGAERMFRRALDIYAKVLPADHVNIGIARAKLGRALLRQQRVHTAGIVLEQAEAILSRQPGPESTWLKTAREDLATVRGSAASPQPPGR